MDCKYYNVNSELVILPKKEIVSGTLKILTLIINFNGNWQMEEFA